MIDHIHCSICGHASPFEVLNRRKEWEALCEEHLLWLLDNTRPEYMPQFRRRKVCCNAVMHDRLDLDRLAANRRYSRTYYCKNKTELLAQRRHKREEILNSVLLQ